MKQQELYKAPAIRVRSIDIQGILCASVGLQPFGMNIDEFDVKDLESLDFDND